MLDRLISGAGAVTDGADRSVRLVAGGARRGFATSRPGSVIVAVALFVLAGLFIVAGIEATDSASPVELDLIDLANGGDHGNRQYVTARGSVSSTYVPSQGDLNANGERDPGEPADEWYYWLVDPTARAGVTVRTSKPPEQVLRFRGTGTLIADRPLANEDQLADNQEAIDAGLTIAPGVVVDATGGAAAVGTALDLAAPLPPIGTRVDVSAARIASFRGICDTDDNGNRACDQDELDRFEILAFEPVSRRGIGVLVRDRPEFGDASSLIGRLHRDESAVEAAQRAAVSDFAGLDIYVSPVYILDEGVGPRSAPLAFGLAAVLIAIGTVIVVGLAGGYLIYRKDGSGLPIPATTLGAGERLPLRITGLVRTSTGLEHVREAPGELIRFVLGRPVAVDGVPLEQAPSTEEPLQTEEPPPTGEPPPTEGLPEPDLVATTLLVERIGHPHGVALGLGELVRLSVGRVMTLRAPRPALRVVAGTGPLLLSFDSDAERDRVAAELLDESGLGPDGTRIETP